MSGKGPRVKVGPQPGALLGCGGVFRMWPSRRKLGHWGCP
jgi:hypothetical protein